MLNQVNNQNLPMTNNINLLQEDCIQKNNINIIFVPSNKKFQTQGSVTSSTKILNAKYNTLNKYENNKNNLDPKKDNLDKIINDSCCKPINLSYKKRIRILK